MPVHLPCGPCALRSWRPADADALARHASSRAVWLRLRDGFPHPYTRANAEGWIAYASAQRPETHFAIDLAGEAVGGIGLVLGEDVERCSAEVGYWLGEAVWGRGLATAALGGLTGYAFEVFGLTRIFAVPFADNTASIRVLEKCGYRFEGRMRRSAVKAGVVKDQALHAITDEDWQA